MREDAPRPQINASKLTVGGGIAGAIFTIGSMLIFLFGVPVIRYMYPAAFVLGCVVALVLRFKRHENPGAGWLLSATDKEPEDVSKRARNCNPRRFSMVLLTAKPRTDLARELAQATCIPCATIFLKSRKWLKFFPPSSRLTLRA